MLTRTKSGAILIIDELKVVSERNIMNTNLISCRKNSKMTQKQVAKEIGISERMYQYLEYGKRLGSVNTLAKLSKLFGKSIEYFL